MTFTVEELSEDVRKALPGCQPDTKGVGAIEQHELRRLRYSP